MRLINFTWPRNYYVSILLLLGLALLPFLLLSYYNHPFMDDYFNAANVRKLGLWAEQRDLYLNWSGRYFSSFLVTATNPMRLNWYAGLRYTPALVLLATFGTAYLGCRVVSSAQMPRQWALLSSLLFMVFLLHLMPEPYSAFYWFTGAMVYQVGGLAVLFTFIASARAQQASRPTNRWLWRGAALLSTVAATASNEMAFLQLLLGLGLLLGVSWQQGRRDLCRWWLVLLGLALVAGVPALMAPGNFARMQYEFSPNPTNQHPLLGLISALPLAVHNTHELLLQSKLWLRLLGITLAWLLMISYWPQEQLRPAFRLPWYVGINFVVVSLLGSMWLIRFTTDRIPPPRTVNALYLFLLTAWLLVLLAARLPLAAWLARVPKGLKLGALPIYLLVISWFSAPRRAWQELLLNAPSFEEQMLTREAKMRGAWSQGVQDLVVPPIMNIKPYKVLITGWDLTKQPDHYVNTETALYFDLKTIRVDEKLFPYADPAFRQ